MTLVISKGITLRKGYIGTDDPDAEAYIAAVEAADEAESPGVGALETATKVAIHSFVKGCKNDGIWPAIKASCILAGARTLTGALVPLVGTAPTSFNFVSGDYNRKTGLVGNGSTKFLNSNRNANADPLNSFHLSAYISTLGTGAFFGPTTTPGAYSSMSTVATRNRNGTPDSYTAVAGFIGASRNNSSTYDRRNSSSTTTITRASVSADGGNTLVNGFSGTANGSARLAFYSIGESLDLALLDARVTDLINAIGAAIP
jgi:hypothetical protein